ncbi:hypothetical protein Tco_0329308, partial [Tanacetum coccineum]
MHVAVVPELVMKNHKELIQLECDARLKRSPIRMTII